MVYKDEKKKSMVVKGRDLVCGLPKTISISSDEVLQALKNNINKIIEATKNVLEETPPELSADIVENGIMLTGGGSLIRGIDKLFSEKLTVPVLISSNPLTSVVNGTGIMLDNIRLIER